MSKGTWIHAWKREMASLVKTLNNSWMIKCQSSRLFFQISRNETAHHKCERNWSTHVNMFSGRHSARILHGTRRPEHCRFSHKYAGSRGHDDTQPSLGRDGHSQLKMTTVPLMTTSLKNLSLCSRWYGGYDNTGHNSATNAVKMHTSVVPTADISPSV